MLPWQIGCYTLYLARLSTGINLHAKTTTLVRDVISYVYDLASLVMSVEIVNFWRKVIRDASFTVCEYGSCDRMCRYSESLNVLKVRCSATR